MWPFKKKQPSGKYRSGPILLSKTKYPRVHCPNRGSDKVKSAGYSDRLECQKCHKVFT